QEARGRKASVDEISRDPGRADAAERELRYYEEYTRPACDLLRSWCGEGAAKLYDDLRSMRGELSRLSALLVDGSRLLSGVGAESDSWSLYSRAFPSDGL